MIACETTPLPPRIFNKSGFAASFSDTISTILIPTEQQFTTQDQKPCNRLKRWYEPTTGKWHSNDPIGISGGLNQYIFCGNNPVNFRDPIGLVAWADAGRAFLGIIGNSAGIALGIGLAVIPEPTMATKVGAVVIMGKSTYGWGVNIRNLSDALLDRPAVSHGSLATDVAELAAPGSQNAQRTANIVDLSTDLVLGLGARQAVANRLGVLNKYATSRVFLTDPTDMGRTIEILQGTELGWTIWDAGQDVLGSYPNGKNKKKCP